MTTKMIYMASVNVIAILTGVRNLRRNLGKTCTIKKDLFTLKENEYIMEEEQ